MNVGLIALLVFHGKENNWRCLESIFYKISKISKEEEVIYLFVRKDKYCCKATKFFWL